MKKDLILSIIATLLSHICIFVVIWLEPKMVPALIAGIWTVAVIAGLIFDNFIVIHSRGSRRVSEALHFRASRLSKNGNQQIVWAGNLAASPLKKLYD